MSDLFDMSQKELRDVAIDIVEDKLKASGTSISGVVEQVAAGDVAGWMKRMANDDQKAQLSAMDAAVKETGSSFGGKYASFTQKQIDALLDSVSAAVHKAKESIETSHPEKAGDELAELIADKTEDLLKQDDKAGAAITYLNRLDFIKDASRSELEAFAEDVASVPANKVTIANVIHNEDGVSGWLKDNVPTTPLKAPDAEIEETPEPQPEPEATETQTPVEPQEEEEATVETETKASTTAVISDATDAPEESVESQETSSEIEADQAPSKEPEAPAAAAPQPAEKNTSQETGASVTNPLADMAHMFSEPTGALENPVSRTMLAQLPTILRAAGPEQIAGMAPMLAQSLKPQLMSQLGIDEAKYEADYKAGVEQAASIVLRKTKDWLEAPENQHALSQPLSVESARHLSADLANEVRHALNESDQLGKLKTLEGMKGLAVTLGIVNPINRMSGVRGKDDKLSIIDEYEGKDVRGFANAMLLSAYGAPGAAEQYVQDAKSAAAHDQVNNRGLRKDKIDEYMAPLFNSNLVESKQERDAITQAITDGINNRQGSESFWREQTGFGGKAKELYTQWVQPGIDRIIDFVLAIGSALGALMKGENPIEAFMESQSMRNTQRQQSRAIDNLKMMDPVDFAYHDAPFLVRSSAAKGDINEAEKALKEFGKTSQELSSAEVEDMYARLNNDLHQAQANYATMNNESLRETGLDIRQRWTNFENYKGQVIATTKQQLGYMAQGRTAEGTLPSEQTTAASSAASEAAQNASVAPAQETTLSTNTALAQADQVSASLASSNISAGSEARNAPTAPNFVPASPDMATSPVAALN